MSVPTVHGGPTVAARTSVAAVLWRSVLAGLAWWGLFAALGGDPGQLRYFSQVTTLTVALVATASVLTWRVTSLRWLWVLAWCRGAATTYAIVTAVIYQELLSGNLAATSSLLEHAIVPILAVLDWVIFGTQRIRQAWWTPLTWLIPPVGYLAVYDNVRDSRGRPLYPFLNPAAGNFGTWIAIMVGVFLALGTLVWAVGRLRGGLRLSVVADRSGGAARTGPGGVAGAGPGVGAGAGSGSRAGPVPDAAAGARSGSGSGPTPDAAAGAGSDTRAGPDAGGGPDARAG